MDTIHALIFGIVEGLTEFLPISSTGHLILTAKIFGLAQTDFLKSFEIAIQLGAILAVVVLYWKKLLVDMEIFKKVLTAFIPTAILGLVLYKIIKKVLLNSYEVVLWSLFLGGIFLIIFEYWHRGKKTGIDDLKKISYSTALLIGVFQSMAMVPGISRAAATIVGGLLLGVTRQTIVEFSFLLAVPTMAAATALDLLKTAHAFSLGQMEFLAVGFVSSFVVAIFSIKFLLYFIKNHTFIGFGVYRVCIALLFWFVLR